MRPAERYFSPRKKSGSVEGTKVGRGGNTKESRASDDENPFAVFQTSKGRRNDVQTRGVEKKSARGIH